MSVSDIFKGLVFNAVGWAWPALQAAGKKITGYLIEETIRIFIRVVVILVSCAILGYFAFWVFEKFVSFTVSFVFDLDWVSVPHLTLVGFFWWQFGIDVWLPIWFGLLPFKLVLDRLRINL